jgi:hypothetical protein
MPVGVQIRTSLRTGPTNPTGPEVSAWFVAGITAQGPTTGRIPAVHNIAEYEQVWGPRTPDTGILYDQAMTFFAEGGGTLYVARGVGPAAQAGGVVINNTDSPAEPALQIIALNPGTADAARIAVDVSSAGAQGAVVKVSRDGQVQETYVGASVTDIVDAMRSSLLVSASPMGASDPTLPPAAGHYTLDGAADDNGAVSLQTLSTALDTLGDDYGPGAVSIPGYTADQVANTLAAHCARAFRVAITAGAQGASVPELASTAAGATGLAEWGGVFAPWVIIPDGSATRTISPEGYIAGVRARAFSIEDQFWQVPAGQRALAQFVRGTDVIYDVDDINELADEYQVSGIITRRGSVYLYQYRSLSVNEQQWALLQSRDTVNALTARLSTALEPFVWDVIDGKHQLESNVLGAMIGVLQPISDQNGLYSEYDADGNLIHNGYIVAATSTADQLGRNTIAATASVKLSPFAALIEIELVKASFTAPLV